MAAIPSVPTAIGHNRFLTGTNFEVAIVATAGGGQANAYPITAQMSRIDTVASTSDSVLLPKITQLGIATAQNAAQGQLVFIYNNGAQTCQVYGATPDTIDNAATGTGVSLVSGGAMIAWAVSYNQATLVGTWNALITTAGATGSNWQAAGSLTSQVNGVTKTFTLPQTPAGDPVIGSNGAFWQKGVDYTIAGTTLTTLAAAALGSMVGTTDTLYYGEYRY